MAKNNNIKVGNKCFKCNATSKEAFLIKAELEGESTFVCAQCLPIIIHGG